MIRETRIERVFILQCLFPFQQDGNSRANRGLTSFFVIKALRVRIKTYFAFTTQPAHGANCFVGINSNWISLVAFLQNSKYGNFNLSTSSLKLTQAIEV